MPYSPESHRCSDPAPEKNQDQSLGGAFLHSLAYEGAQKPVKALAQISDQIGLSQDLEKKVSFMSAPQAADFQSSTWYAQQLGGAAGKIVPLGATMIATHKALGATVTDKVALNSIGGFGAEAVFTPSESKGELSGSDFYAQRFKNGLIGAATFGAMTVGSLALHKAGGELGVKALQEGSLNMSLSGIPAGLFSAESHARLYEARSATFEEKYQSAFTMFVVGGPLGAFQGKPAETRAEGSSSSAKAMTGSLGRSYEHFDRFMASINPLLKGNQPAFALAGDAMAMQPRVDWKANVMFKDYDGDTVGSKSRSNRSAGKGSERTRGAEGEQSEARQAKGERLADVLKDLDLKEVARFVAEHPTFKSQRVLRSLGGTGNDSPAVLELAASKEFPNGGALKVTIPEGGWQVEWGQRPFDAKLLSRVHDVDLGANSMSGTAHVYVQELVDVKSSYDPHLTERFWQKVQDSGLDMTDPGSGVTGQVGISRETGDLVLIDYPAVDKPGSNQTLNEIIGGHEAIEEGWDAENEAIRRGETPKHEEPEHDQIFDGETEARRQEALSKGEFTETERELLQQLRDGIPEREVREFAAILQGKYDGKGNPDLKAVKVEMDRLIRQAKAMGLTSN